MAQTAVRFNQERARPFSKEWKVVSGPSIKIGSRQPREFRFPKVPGGLSDELVVGQVSPRAVPHERGSRGFSREKEGGKTQQAW